MKKSWVITLCPQTLTTGFVHALESGSQPEVWRGGSITRTCTINGPVGKKQERLPHLDCFLNDLDSQFQRVCAYLNSSVQHMEYQITKLAVRLLPNFHITKLHGQS